MKFLYDTCSFLWFVLNSPELPQPTKKELSDAANDVSLSVISLWEIALKVRIGRLKLPKEISFYVNQEKDQNGLKVLALDAASVYHLSKLPDLHRDPFDRMLICQAMEHGLTLVTPDAAIRRYPIKTAWGN